MVVYAQYTLPLEQLDRGPAGYRFFDVADANLESQIAAIALLDDPTRRGLYLFIAGRRCEVGRDEAASALCISRALAAFHLDKLVQQGLLDASYRRLTTRRGPGAGRPAKLYRRSARQVELTLPERRYELAGRVFARALTAIEPAARGALARAARAEGRTLGAAARARTGPNVGTDRLLANECRPLVCGTNLALLRGLLAAAGARGTRAELRAPQAGSCCVILKTSAHTKR